MWIKCNFENDKFEYTINLNVYGTFTYGCPFVNVGSDKFLIKYVDSWRTIILKHITGKDLSLYIEKLINNNFNGILVIDEELEKLICGKFPTIDEFNENK